MDAFDGKEECSLIVCAHPLSETSKSGLYKFNGDFSSLDLMKLSDAVITDYSACAFEAALLKKPLYFYVPDYDVYKKEQGLNIDILTALEGTAFVNAENLLQKVISDNYDFNLLTDFSDKYVENKNTNNTELLAEFICSLLK